MKALITGHKGFIGRHFKDYLERQGYQVFGLDIKDGMENDCRLWFRSPTFTEVFDLVIHCAAIVGGREMIEGDPISVATDLSIDAEMFNWAVRTKQPKVVYFSSSAAYPTDLQNGEPTFLREGDISLEMIYAPDMTYGWSKLTGEMLAGYARQQGVNVYVFRPFSGYGADQDLTYPFPSFIKRIKDRENPFVIWGDGNQVRDFIHVDDIVEGVMAAIEKNEQQPINLGTGVPVSFKQLALLMFKESGFEPELKFLTDKPVGVKYRCADITFMSGIYLPKVSLPEGIKRALYEKN